MRRAKTIRMIAEMDEADRQRLEARRREPRPG
jgi:hypothetical protein